MAIEYFLCDRQYHASIIGPTIAGPREKNSKLRLSEGRNSLRLVFAKMLFHKRAILLIF